MQPTKERIVIIGFGWVGQANALALSLMGYAVSYVDPQEPPHHFPKYESQYKKLTRITDPHSVSGESTVYIVCVGDRVSEDGTQDISLIEQALTSLQGIAGTVILRSTILPGKLRDLSFDYYFPEFLHEKVAVEECVCPYIFVIGIKNQSRELSFLNEFKKRAHKRYSGTPEEAAHIKYLWNLWNAVRIAFVNEFGNTIALPSSKENLDASAKIIDFMFDHRDYMRYGRSFGGHCLPKDTRAYVRWYKNAGRDMSLLDGTYQSNTAHQKIESQYPILPEWYSKYPERHISAKVALKALWHSVAKRIGL